MHLYQFEDTKALHSLTCCPELPVCKPLSSLLPPRVSAFDKRAHKGEGTLTTVSGHVGGKSEILSYFFT